MQFSLQSKSVTFTAPIVIVRKGDGTLHFHASNCRRVREARRAPNVSVWDDEMPAGRTVLEFARATFGDIVADAAVDGTSAYDTGCMFELSSLAHVHDCASGLVVETVKHVRVMHIDGHVITYMSDGPLYASGALVTARCGSCGTLVTREPARLSKATLATFRHVADA